MRSWQERVSRLRAVWVTDTGWTDRDRLAWTNITLRISMAKIEAQRSEVVRIRTQALLFVTFLGTALAFLIGAVVNPQINRTPTFYALSSVGTVLLGILAVLLVLVVAPIVKFNFSLNAQTLLGWMGGPAPAADYLEAAAALVNTIIPSNLKHNRERIVLLRWLFAALLLTGLTALTMWIWTLWACA